MNSSGLSGFPWRFAQTGELQTSVASTWEMQVTWKSSQRCWGPCLGPLLGLCRSGECKGSLWFERIPKMNCALFLSFIISSNPHETPHLEMTLYLRDMTCLRFPATRCSLGAPRELVHCPQVPHRGLGHLCVVGGWWGQASSCSGAWTARTCRNTYRPEERAIVLQTITFL